MPRVAKPRRALRRTYLKEWRLYRGMTQEQAGEALDLDRSQLSRIERAQQPYSQALLETAAELYNCAPADILRINPLDETQTSELERLLDQADPKIRSEIIGYVKGRIGSTLH